MEELIFVAHRPGFFLFIFRYFLLLYSGLFVTFVVFTLQFSTLTSPQLLFVFPLMFVKLVFTKAIIA